MKVTVEFLGAAGEVTGSKYLLQIGDYRLLVDCGMFQGRKELRELNRSPFPVAPATIDAVILTHAHLDHTGYLPRLFREGFKGPVYCTTATSELMKLILLDSAKIQGEEAAYARKKSYSKHEDPEPFYSLEDVTLIEDYVETTEFGKELTITPEIKAVFHNAGHILGAAIVVLSITGESTTGKIVFSGDLGRENDPILYPPKHIKDADILFVESTYGDRTINTTGREEIIESLNNVFQKNGNVVVPAFSIGRTQSLLMYIKNVLMSGEIPKVKVVVDSPMAISATAFYRKYKDYHKLSGIDLDEDESFMTLRKNLVVSRSAEESRKINDLKSGCIIIAGNGMMSGGRVLHHLAQRLPDPDNLILICGYQAEGSRGRKLQDGESTLRMFGKEIPVRAKVKTISGLSAHADRTEILSWLSGFTNPPALTFVVHGEKAGASSLASALTEKGWNVTVPHYLQTVELFENI